MKKRLNRRRIRVTLQNLPRVSILTAIALIIVVLLSSRIKFPERTDVTSLQYAVSGCDRSKASGIELPEASIHAENNYITLQQKLNYLCCANITLDWEKSGYNIKIREINTGEICKCACAYNLNASLGPLEKGEYSIELYGVEYKGQGAELILRERVRVDNQSTECRTSRDCVPAECCHASSCVPASRAPSCGKIMCTMDCQENTMDCGQGYCTCTEGKCEAVI